MTTHALRGLERLTSFITQPCSSTGVTEEEWRSRGEEATAHSRHVLGHQSAIHSSGIRVPVSGTTHLVPVLDVASDWDFVRYYCLGRSTKVTRQLCQTSQGDVDIATIETQAHCPPLDNVSQRHTPTPESLYPAVSGASTGKLFPQTDS